ncbi:MAG TPA: sigma-54 dependent transcriptional regulator [Blastocatellia bacterium]|nr:sigma-54 dependent transcriptional regulator [Blastocatellia bacterium]
MSTISGLTPILVIDDDPAMLSLARFFLEEQGYEVTTTASSEDALRLIQQKPFALALTDFQLPGLDGLELVKRIKDTVPDIEIIMITGYGSFARAIEATKAGAFYFFNKPVDFDQLLPLIERALESRQNRLELEALRRKFLDDKGYHGIIGSSDMMQRIYDLIESVAESDANVLIVGESGTGKELVANAIHIRSHRAKQPFMQVNCAALPKELIESELFGHTKGAFTGATNDKVGLIGRAAGGSLLLDEISEMPLELQPKLLRVLQERVYYRVGSEKALAADFRLVAATNRNPLDAIRDGHLREDLYYRLNTIELHIPPLRERMQDVPQLAEHFLQRYSQKYGREVKRFSEQATQQLIEHHWPGNVRELQNAIERAVLMSRGEEVMVLHLPSARSRSVASANEANVSESVVPSVWSTPIPESAVSPTPAPAVASIISAGNLANLSQVTIEQLCRMIVSKLPEPQTGTQADELFKQLEVYLAHSAVERTKGNKQAAANMLGIYRPRLYSLLRKGNGQDVAPKASVAVEPVAAEIDTEVKDGGQVFHAAQT